MCNIENLGERIRINFGFATIPVSTGITYERNYCKECLSFCSKLEKNELRMLCKRA